MATTGAIDHQEPAGTDFAAHIEDVVTTLRAAFPDLRFELHELRARAMSWPAARR